jgi:hypothetical protein
MPNKFVETITSSDASIYSITNSYTPYYTANEAIPHDGFVRTNNGGLEYYDGSDHCWLPLPGSDVRIEIAPHVQVVLDWAYAKMQEECEIDTLAATYPAFKAAKENYELIKALVQK